MLDVLKTFYRGAGDREQGFRLLFVCCVAMREGLT